MSVTQQMQTPAPLTSSSRAVPNRRRRRWQSYWRTVFARGDVSSLLMVWALMLVSALAVRAAEWTTGLGVLGIVSWVAIGLGFLLARSHYSELVALVFSTIYSMLVVVGANALVLVESGSLRSRVFALFDRLEVWMSEAVNGEQAANNDLAFVVFLSILFWFLGHNSAWHVFRVDRVWRVIIPAGLVVITNQFYYQGDARLDLYLVAFVLISLLLLIRSHIDAREFDWYLHRVSFPRYVRRTFFQAGAVLSLVIILAAWVAPAGSDDKSLERLQAMLEKDPLAELNELLNRLFSSLESQGIATTDYYGGETLKLGGPVQLGAGEVMIVEAPYGPRYYWRSTVFDIYDFRAREWDHSDAARSVLAYNDSGALQLNIGSTVPGARREVEQTFEMVMPVSPLVYAAPQPVYLGLPVEVELRCIEEAGTGCVNENRPSDISVTRARRTLREGDTYTVVSSISVAQAADLRLASQDYPDWVEGLYLQGRDQLSIRIQQLAAQIVANAGAVTPYDKAKAIERWLRVNITYNESIDVPPSDGDVLEWFLFERQEGYCNYYATAMVMMLRSQGIPARMAAGFAQGHWDSERGVFEVREGDAHTWVEVYFPGYGWVEFEPTADETPPDRGDESLPQSAPLPSPTPWPTDTPLPPTATFTPTVPLLTETATVDLLPSPTLTPTMTAPADDAALSTGLPSPTPTLTPTPTEAPAPPPDVARVDSGNERPIWKTILLTVAIFVLVVAVIVLAIVFMIWYVEYRGLGGLNIIQRTYARLGIYGRWVGVNFDESATPFERRRHLVGEVPDGEKPINTITSAYIQDRYAPPAPQAMDQEKTFAAQEAWQEARWVFIRRKLGRLFRRSR
ncbi:MAG: hypothetical protein GYB65_08570 [Chloroflexi bacterium]|nr:hypothetical protein [Chloroflexota bacterium]